MSNITLRSFSILYSKHYTSSNSTSENQFTTNITQENCVAEKDNPRWYID